MFRSLSIFQRLVFLTIGYSYLLIFYSIITRYQDQILRYSYNLLNILPIRLVHLFQFPYNIWREIGDIYLILSSNDVNCSFLS